MDPHIIINLLHVLLIAPFLLWVGISRTNVPQLTQHVLLVLGVIVTLYHGFKAWNRYVKNSGLIWINLVHFLVVGPLLVYIGANKEKTPRAWFEILLLTGFAALGQHLYELVQFQDFL